MVSTLTWAPIDRVKRRRRSVRRFFMVRSGVLLIW
jgi:hypothetical protein